MLTEFEAQILKAIIKVNSNKNLCEKLYKQVENITVVRREFTGCGFYTEFHVNSKNYKLDNKEKIMLGGIIAELSELEHGTNFILYIENGLIQTLEGFCYDEQWPDNTTIIKLFSVSENGSLIPME